MQRPFPLEGDYVLTKPVNTEIRCIGYDMPPSETYKRNYHYQVQDGTYKHLTALASALCLTACAGVPSPDRQPWVQGEPAEAGFDADALAQLVEELAARRQEQDRRLEKRQRLDAKALAQRIIKDGAHRHEGAADDAFDVGVAPDQLAHVDVEHRCPDHLSSTFGLFTDFVDVNEYRLLRLLSFTECAIEQLHAVEFALFDRQRSLEPLLI